MQHLDAAAQAEGDRGDVAIHHGGVLANPAAGQKSGTCLRPGRHGSPDKHTHTRKGKLTLPRAGCC